MGEVQEDLRQTAQAAVQALRARKDRLDDDSIDLILRDARSHYAWTDRPVSEAMLRTLYDITIQGPTSMNTCPARFIFITTDTAKDRLAKSLKAKNIEKMRAAPVTAIIAWDPLYWQRLDFLFPHEDRKPMFAGNAAFGFVQQYAQVFMVAQEDFTSLIRPGLLTVAAVFVFWLRFKVPFAMALIALGLFATALLAAATGQGTPQSLNEVFVLSADSNFAWITLALGIVTFGAAMYFDGSDPHRVTRRSAQGFWLHLVAAPMIINTVALSILSNDPGSTSTILAAMAGFALVAVIIDRRSFLLAAIAYVVSVLLTLNPAFEDAQGARVILGLGVFLVILGAFWARIRAGLLKTLPLGRLRAYLPPAH